MMKYLAIKIALRKQKGLIAVTDACALNHFSPKKGSLSIYYQ
jgi:hypothetical protein